MSAKRISVFWESGDLLFEGTSALGPTDAYEEPCPPTKRSPGSGSSGGSSGSGTFPAVAPVTEEDDDAPETNRAA